MLYVFIIYVAPFTGAWIEISNVLNVIDSEESLPSRERGLKFRHVGEQLACLGSLPSRERGLKSNEIASVRFCADVAPFTGAWIEMLSHLTIAVWPTRRSLHGSVD